MTKTQTMNGFIVTPNNKKTDTKKKATKVPVKDATDERDSSLDLAWTIFAAVFILLGRSLKWSGRHIVGIAATAFLIENLILLQHITGFSFK